MNTNQIIKQAIKKPSSFWNVMYVLETGRYILDPDGWDRKNFEYSWEEPITWKEFNERAMMSTIDAVGHETRTRVLDQAITQAVVEREKELAKQLEQTILFWEKNFDEQGYEDWPSIIRSFIKYELNSKIDKLTK